MVYGHLTNQEGDTPPMNNSEIIDTVKYLGLLT